MFLSHLLTKNASPKWENVPVHMCWVAGRARADVPKSWPEDWHTPTLAGLEETALGCPVSKPVHTHSCHLAKPS